MIYICKWDTSKKEKNRLHRSKHFYVCFYILMSANDESGSVHVFVSACFDGQLSCDLIVGRPLPLASRIREKARDAHYKAHIWIICKQWWICICKVIDAAFQVWNWNEYTQAMIVTKEWETEWKIMSPKGLGSQKRKPKRFAWPKNRWRNFESVRTADVPRLFILAQLRDCTSERINCKKKKSRRARNLEDIGERWVRRNGWGPDPGEHI